KSICGPEYSEGEQDGKDDEPRAPEVRPDLHPRDPPHAHERIRHHEGAPPRSDRKASSSVGSNGRIARIRTWSVTRTRVISSATSAPGSASTRMPAGVDHTMRTFGICRSSCTVDAEGGSQSTSTR